MRGSLPLRGTVRRWKWCEADRGPKAGIRGWGFRWRIMEKIMPLRDSDGTRASQIRRQRFVKRPTKSITRHGSTARCCVLFGFPPSGGRLTEANLWKSGVGGMKKLQKIAGIMGVDLSNEILKRRARAAVVVLEEKWQDFPRVVPCSLDLSACR